MHTHGNTPRVHLLTAALLLSSFACRPTANPVDDTDDSESVDSSGTTSSDEVDETNGTETDGTETDGTETDGTETDGGETDECNFSGTPIFTCTTDADCMLTGDCCDCAAYNPQQGVVIDCGGNCAQNKCTEWGFDQAACIDGECVVAGKSCNQDLVVCDEAAPPCGDNTLPQVMDGCWTGTCLPIEACDWVPNCSYCAAEDFCVTKQGPGCVEHSCTSPYAECPNPTCACLDYLCDAPFSTCSEGAEGIVCE